MDIRTRFAPSPTGYMHIGNLRTAIFEYLIAKSQSGKFILRIEDTDSKRQVEGSVDVIYNTLNISGLKHDEGPDIGGSYGPYIQSQRKGIYIEYAKQLVETGKAYYCFCSKERLDTLFIEGAENAIKYDRHCLVLSKDEVEINLACNIPYIIRQLIPDGETTFTDEVYGSITVNNADLDDQVLIKSDGMPTYNFANVVDDHLMKISHVVRGCEYLSSTPKYNLLYDAFGWDTPKYVHLPLVLNSEGVKLSKRKGDASFEDLLAQGFLPEAIMNFIALLGWSPADTTEFFTLAELEKIFDVKGLSKSPSIFDITKLTWMNSEYFKKMDFDIFFSMAEKEIKSTVKRSVDTKIIAKMVQSRINFITDIPQMLDFIDTLPEYDTELYVHKKMKTDRENSLSSLKETKKMLELQSDWTNEALYAALQTLAEKLDVKKSVILWPLRTALSGKAVTPCGATEIAEILGKDETLSRIDKAIRFLSVQHDSII
ncbi:MAG: glutamate--tRNA ligase [Eubacteriales bacterium]